jgi:hypothetical protein
MYYDGTGEGLSVIYSRAMTAVITCTTHYIFMCMTMGIIYRLKVRY